ncbi:hypothetical protein BD770DRAFT_415933 [Pilaira anomala]|nr:hypothetical protein BD770DRAFT_415933 [Pilaira anomala]
MWSLPYVLIYKIRSNHCRCSVIYIRIYSSFCIYNKVVRGGPSFDVYAQPEVTGSFHKNIGPGGKEYRHWSDKCCNESSRQNGIVEFKVHFGEYVKAVLCRARGSIVFIGSSPSDITYIRTFLSGFQEQISLKPS